MGRGQRTLFVVLLVAAVVAVLGLFGVIEGLPFLGGGSSSGGAASDGALLDEEAIDDVERDAASSRLAASPLAERPGGSGGDAAGLAPGEGAAAAPAALGLDGVVLTADGRPASHARVQAFDASGASVLALTDAQGRFHLDLAAGRYDLVLRAGRDGALVVRGLLVDGQALATPLQLEGASTLEVSVTKDGRAAPGLPVRARLLFDGASQLVAEGATDGLGVFAADAVPSGPYTIEVVPLEGVAVSKRLELSGPARLDVVLPLDVRFTGLVQDADTRAPVPAALELTVITAEGFTVTATGTASAEGVFDLVVPRGRPQRVLVTDPAYAPWPTDRELGGVLGSLSGLRSQDAVVRNVVLRRGATVRGRVLLQGTKEAVPSLTLRFVPQQGTVFRLATTTEEGLYEVKGLGAGVYRALLETPGWYAKSGTDTVRIPAAGEGAAPPELTLDLEVWSAGVVSGSVALADGSPASRARVWLVGGGGVVRGARSAGRLLETLTSPSGQFLLDDVPPNEWIRVRAALGEAEAVPSNGFRIADGPVPPFQLVLAPTGRFHGRVVDLATREPLSGARVQVDPVGEPGGRGGRTLTTDAEGRYDVGNLILGRWRLTPNRRQDHLPGEPKEHDLTAELREQAVDLTLDPGLAVGGVVTDLSGNALPSARFVFTGVEDVGTPPASVRRNGATDGAGAFRFTGLRSGRYSLLVRRSGYREVRLDLRGGEDRMRIQMTPNAAPR